MIIEPPKGPFLKLARAQKHLKFIRKMVDRYVEKYPDVMTPQSYIDSTRRVVSIGLQVKEFDPEISIRIGEFLHSARGALDHVIFAALIANDPPELEKFKDTCQFPICDSPDEFRKAGWRITGLAEETKAAIERLQPYQRGDDFRSDPLRTLRQLSNTDKHRLIHPVLAVPFQAGINVQSDPLTVPYHTVWNTGPLEGQAIVAKLFFSAMPFHVKVHARGSIAIALYDGFDLLGSVDVVLGEIYKRVEESISALLLHC
jgi:hypothetical protein